MDLRTHLRRAVRKRWAKATKEERKEATSKAGRAAWAELTPEQRSAEMKRRAQVRARNRTKKTRSR
jgi:hypothetical protein